MKHRFISFIIMSAFCFTIIATVNACSIIEEPATPYYVLNPYKRYTALEKPDVDAGGTIKITLAKNEGEGAQFSVFSQTKEFTDMVISATDLKSDTGDILNSDCIDLFRYEYTYYNAQTGETLPTRDGSTQILVPLSTEEFNTFDTIKNRNLIYYIKVTTPETMNAGTYTGKILLKHSDGEFSIPLEVKVLDFSLQTRPVLRTDLLYWADFTPRYYEQVGYNLTNEEIRELYDQALEICRANKLTVTNAYDVPGDGGKTPERYASDIKDFLEANPTVTTFNAPIKYSDWANRIINTEQTLPLLNALKEEGILSMAIMYSVDEPHNDTDYANINNLGEWTDKYCPELQNYVPILSNAIDWNKVNSDAIDIFCYAYGGCSVNELKAGQTGERTLWAYAFDKSTKMSHSQIRLMGWECKKFNIEGIEDWCLNNFAYGYDSENLQWLLNKEMAMNQSYIYPATEGDGVVNKNMFLPTIIIEQFRDAIEDYEYLLLLENKVQERIDKWGLDITIHEAMESYYDGCFLDVHRLPYNEEANFGIIRDRVISEIENGVPYIMLTEKDNENWLTDNRFITIYTDKDSSIVFNDKVLETIDTGNYSYAETYMTIGSESKTVSIECMGKTTLHHMLSKDFDKQKIIDLSDSEIYEGLKQANPNTEFEIIEIDGSFTLKVTFDESTKRGFSIPAELMSSSLGGYYRVRMRVWAEDDDNEYSPVCVLVSNTATVLSDVSEQKPTTDQHTSFTLWFNKTQAESLNQSLKYFRITLDKTYTQPVTMYFADIYFINEENNFEWEIVG